MKASLMLASLIALLPFGCSGGFGTVRTASVLNVSVSTPVGTRDTRIPIPVTKAARFRINIEMQKKNGELDTDFNGFVRISAKPGNVKSVSGPGAIGRNVELKNGRAENVDVDLIAAFGNTFIWVDEIGYVASAKENPACSDGVDNNGNGLIDFPADPGCAFANDDSEEGGTYASGSSDTIFFAEPRIADVRGVELGGGTPSFPNEQVRLDTGFREGASKPFAFNTVVTRIAADGFYVTDLDDPRGYSSIYMFNFNAPPQLRVCDRLTSLTGTSTVFYGFTQLSFPTWSAEFWNPEERPCLVPEPYAFTTGNLKDEVELQRRMASLVRLAKSDTATVRVSKHFGPNKIKNNTPEDDASSCDLNDDGLVDFYTEPEKGCSDACDLDVECTEFSEFRKQGTFNLSLTDAGGSAKIQVDGSVSVSLKPLTLRGKEIKAFSGTLRYFSGGDQYTIEARCADDIILDLSKSTVPSDKACVFARTASDNNNVQ
ncbi:MAG: hypothetical protein KBF88_11640 [Polyangiaceae bacterium]|nr:hypothetical protein [Polyangiaceae bacterium]